MVDAKNAFNNLNRNAALKNIKELCPPFYQYLYDTYRSPARIVIPGEQKYDTIYSDEGYTQGDVASMAKYGIATKPLNDKLADSVNSDLCKQIWYADDSSSAGQVTEMRKWWDVLCKEGPSYGYFPLPTKTVLIVKPEYKELAMEAFEGTGVKITTEGERHMGAVIGSETFKELYVKEKIEKWVKDVEELAEIAKDEPQAVYASFTKAVSHRWTYVQRTIPGIDDLFTPLEEAIRDRLIPSLLGRKVSNIERRILALPVRYGGLGIRNPTTASCEFLASSKVTDILTQIIVRQERDFTNYNEEEVQHCIDEVKKLKELRFKEELESIKGSGELNVKFKRMLELIQEKGSGSWLTALPIQSLGYSLNKQEFRDGICLRYGWNIPNTPSYCQCGKENNIDHTLNCKSGGYVSMRHNRIRDLEADLMKEVC